MWVPCPCVPSCRHHLLTPSSCWPLWIEIHISIHMGRKAMSWRRGLTQHPSKSKCARPSADPLSAIWHQSMHRNFQQTPATFGCSQACDVVQQSLSSAVTSHASLADRRCPRSPLTPSPAVLTCACRTLKGSRARAACKADQHNRTHTDAHAHRQHLTLPS